MNLIITKDYEEMSKLSAMKVIEYISSSANKRVNLSITGGQTPKRMYEILNKIVNNVSLPNVHYYNFDEIPLKGSEGLTITALKELFYEPSNIPKEQIEIFNENNYHDFEDKIKQDGGIDMVILGLGKDGHFCGNLSGTLNGYEEGCRSVSNTLNETIATRLAFLCGGEENMTEYYVTFGPKTIMEAKEVIMIVNGVDKATILKKVLESAICKEIPSSILRLHPNFTIICDQEAASLLNK